MSAVPPGHALVVLGLGPPHDALVAAACTPWGGEARSAGALDVDAEARGRDALPRGACAPLLHTTGALLRAARAGGRLAVLSLSSCGPCRYALFETSWQRALAAEGLPPVHVVALPQARDAALAWLAAPAAGRILEGIAVADAIVAATNRLLPRAVSVREVEAHAAALTSSLEADVARGASPLDALAHRRAWHAAVRRAPPRPLATARLVGDPWSMHANGDGQLHVPRVLAPLGVEVLVPPALTWARYALWLARASPWGRERPATDDDVCRARALDATVVRAWRDARLAADLVAPPLPDPDRLAELAAPFLPPELRGGYGHVEVGLARDARLAGDVDAVVSVKSFGCMPSSGVSDAIVPLVLGDEVPFLALEVCSDGQAARESRLALLASEARRHALSRARSEVHA